MLTAECCLLIKWANDQEAVTFPWLPAHSILKWIGGDISMLDPFRAMSSLFQSSRVAICSPCSSEGAARLKPNVGALGGRAKWDQVPERWPTRLINVFIGQGNARAGISCCTQSPASARFHPVSFFSTEY
jgi:hypothetical protein